jgi:hypothetical protein
MYIVVPDSSRTEFSPVSPFSSGALSSSCLSFPSSLSCALAVASGRSVSETAEVSDLGLVSPVPCDWARFCALSALRQRSDSALSANPGALSACAFRV